MLGSGIVGRKTNFWPFWVLGVLLLVFSGVGYRVAATRLKINPQDNRLLHLRLSNFPMAVADWAGRDVPISETIQRVAATDDFLSRLYVDKHTSGWVNVYVAYSGRPGTMLGHRPDVCYTGAGWIHDSTEPSSFISRSGRHIPCLVHRFHMPKPRVDEIVVLNFYIVNGHISNDEGRFSGLEWRRPNVDGRVAHYVAQVQVSSVLENSVRSAAEDIADLIVDFFPDENGEVNATKYANSIDGVTK